MRGIVVCVHPRAAEEGAKVLEAGGNAFDAAVTTAFVQMVVIPFSCGVSGMMSAHILAPAMGDHVVIDGCMRAGSLASDDMWANDYLGEAAVSGTSLFTDHRSTMGYSSICTPGAVAALGEIYGKYCTMPWNELLQPAIRVARDGFVVTPELQETLSVSNLLSDEPSILDRVQSNGPCASIYLDESGVSPKAGSILRNPDYAETIERLAINGAADLYTGELASDISEDLERNDSFITREDFAEYETKSYTPISTDYRGYKVFSNSAPGAGPLLIEALNILNGMDMRQLGHGTTEYLERLASTLQLVNQDRIDFLGDPEIIGTGPLNMMISDQRASELRERVLNGEIGRMNPSLEDTDTTHLTVVDGQGNVASITHSLGNISGVVTPGLGFVHNNGMNRYDPRPGRASSIMPRKARLHLMMPSIALENSRLAMAFGAPGGNAILSALTQIVSNVIDFDMTAVEAVTAPRIHAEGQKIWCEARVRSSTCDDLRSKGFEVVQDAGSLSRRVARAQLVIIGSGSQLDGGSDPRGPMGVVYSEI